jgi:hypothetical protein
MASADKGLEEIPEGELIRGIQRQHTASSRQHKALRTCANINCFTGQIESNYDETVDSFDTMNLKAELLRGRFEIPALR